MPGASPVAFDATQLAALESAAASGQLVVRYGDREIRYQSLAELMGAIEVARRDVAGTTSLRSTRRYPEYHRA